MYYYRYLYGSRLKPILLEIENNNCQFFDSFGIFVQIFLGLLYLGLLMCKRNNFKFLYKINI